MEFVPTPAVHRVLCADCGESIAVRSLQTMQCRYLMLVQEIQLFPTLQTCVSIASGIRKLVPLLLNPRLPAVSKC